MVKDTTVFANTRCQHHYLHVFPAPQVFQLRAAAQLSRIPQAQGGRPSPAAGGKEVVGVLARKVYPRAEGTANAEPEPRTLALEGTEGGHKKSAKNH